MMDISVKVSEAVNSESDLEEGEIPEFEVSSYGIHEGKDSKLSGKGESSKRRKSRANSYFKKGRKRNASPPSEGEYISDEEKWISGDEILQKDVYENNLAGRRAKYMRPFQKTYGCVEDLMTKIGESLGRNSNYYKNRRLKEDRHIFKVNNGWEVDSSLKEFSPVLERLRYNSCKKSQYRETKADYTSNIKDTFEKMKYRNSLNDRKIGQEVMRKRKREDCDFIQTGDAKTETSKEFKVLDQKGNPGTEYKRILKEKHSAISTRLFKEIPLPQEREGQEVRVHEVIEIDDSDEICHRDSDSLQHGKMEKNQEESCNVSNWDDYPGSRNSTDLSEQMDDEDKDDDLELIQLRLLALTSNKKKNKVVNKDCYYNNLNVFNLYGDRKSPDESKVNEDDEEDNNKSQGNSSPSNNETMSTCKYESDIDRYELFLRAEALKTALLKKHQHILKKRKNSRLNPVSYENSDKSLDGYDIEVTEAVKIGSNVSEKEVSSLTDEGNCPEPQSDAVEAEGDCLEPQPDTVEVESNCPESQSDTVEVEGDCLEPQPDTVEAESNCLEPQSNAVEVEGLVDKNAESVPNLGNVVKTALEEGSIATTESNAEMPSSNPCERSSPVGETPENSEKPIENPNLNLKNPASSYQSGKKKIKRLKMRKNRKPRNSNSSESNIAQNNLTSTNKEDCQNVNNLNIKDGDEPQEKFNLLNSLGASNVHSNDSPSACGAQSVLDPESDDKGSVPDKSSGPGLSSAQAARIPAAEVERIIIHLGSESSDEESSPQPHESSVTEANAAVAPSEVKPSNPDPAEVQKRLNDYEKSVELLLRGARRMIEKKSELSSRAPPTPEAVYNHLAPSQRLEYLRLKQKIAEREKLRQTNKNTIVSSTSEKGFNTRNRNAVAMKNVNPSKSQNIENFGQLPAKKLEGSKIKEMPGFNLERLKKDMRSTPGKKLVRNAPHFGPLGSTGRASPVPKAVASDGKQGNEPRPEKVAINKLNNVKKQNLNADLRSFVKKGLPTDKSKFEDDLKVVNELRKKIKVERLIEEKYEMQIKSLKFEQNFYEHKKNEQKLKIKKLIEKIKQIEASRRNSKTVEAVGKRKKSQPSKEEPAEKGSLPKEAPKTVEQATPVVKTGDVEKVGEGDSAEQTKNACVEAEKETGDEKVMEKVTVTESDKEQLVVYSSPLDILNSGYESVDCPRVDPNIIMCQYDLLGKCNDAECAYQHWRT